MLDASDIDGAVSLWVGVSPSLEALEAYLEIDYTGQESSAFSQFADDFGIEYYDEDFSELHFSREPTRSLSELLRGCSYDQVIVPMFVRLCGEQLADEANAFVMLYNYRHTGPVRAGGASGGNVKLRYVGSIKVDMPWPD